MLKKITLRVDEGAVKIKDGERFNILAAFRSFLHNRPALGATLAAVGMVLGMNSASTATTIMFATYFGQAKLSGIATLIGFLPMLLFLPFIKGIVAKWGKKEAATAGTLISVLGGLLMLVFPLIGDKTVAFGCFILALCIYGVGLGIYTCVSWALMADAIDYNEWRTGRREEGTVYSLHSFFRKLAQGIGPSVILLLMGALGYVSAKGTGGQSATTAANMCWLVAGLYLFSAVLQFLSIAFVYNLDKKTVDTMMSELAEKKSEQ